MGEINEIENHLIYLYCILFTKILFFILYMIYKIKFYNVFIVLQN
jgi:hypothetical protein